VTAKLDFGDADSGIKVVVGQGGIQDGVRVVPQVGRFDAAGRRSPAVEEEDYRRPHLMLAWTGAGRSVLKIVPRRGTAVHRSVVEKVPSGFGEG